MVATLRHISMSRVPFELHWQPLRFSRLPLARPHQEGVQVRVPAWAYIDWAPISEWRVEAL